MRTRLLRRASIGALALTLIGVAGAGIARADNVVNTLGASGTVTSAAPGQVVSVDYKIAGTGGDGEGGCNATPTSPATVTLSVPAAVTASQTSMTFTDCTPSKVTVTFSATAVGNHEINVASITDSSAGTYKNEANWVLRISATNTAPSAPGAPGASANPTQGGFTLSWATSADDQDDEFTYTLEGKDADDLGFATVASGLATASYSFGATAPAEGTWTYRVKAVETSTLPPLSSSYSTLSGPVVVDQSDPNAPTVSATADPDYEAPDRSKWWKDAVTVSFGWNGDPALGDTSAGSGEGTTTAPEPISTSGKFTSTGTAIDRAGNESVPTSFVGFIDSTDPTVTCPASSVVLGTSGATIPWEATDSGDSSGLVASEGTIAVDANTVGAARTVTIPEGTAEDNVGNKSPATSCTYQVRYAWDAFLQPINDTAHDQIAMSVFKAGSTVPVKFQIKDAKDVVVTATVAPGWPTPKLASSCSLVGGDLEAAASVSATTGTTFRWDATSGQYIYNWSTKGFPANTCWEIGVTLDDGLTHTVIIGLKK